MATSSRRSTAALAAEVHFVAQRRSGLLVEIFVHPRLLAIIDLVTALFEIEVAHEGVAVERGLFQRVVGAEQHRAAVHGPRAQHRVARRHVVDAERLVGNEIGRQRHRVAHRARPEEGQHDVGALAHAPACERLAEVLVMLGQAGFAGDVEQAEQAPGRIERKAHEVAHAFGELALEHVVESDPGIGKVAEHIADASPHRARQHGLIHLRGRLEGDLVNLVVEAEHGAVEALEGIVRVAGGGTAGHQRGGKGGGGETGAGGAENLWHCCFLR